MTNNLNSQQQGTLNKIMMDAIKAGDLDQLKLVVAKGADVHAKVSIPKITEYLHGTTSSPFSQSILHYTLNNACQNQQEIIDFLVEQGVDIDALDDDKNTPLFHVVSSLSIRYVAQFLSKGANPLIQNAAGESPLDKAYKIDPYFKEREKILKALLSALPDVKKDFNQATSPGVTLTRNIQAAPSLVFKPAVPPAIP